MGVVYFAGTGPGDPALIPLRGAELLRRADRVLAATPLSPRLLDHVADPGVVEVGDDIESRLVAAAEECPIVVRLIAGDPFRSAAAISEMEALRAVGVRFEVITAPSRLFAAPGFAGVPLLAENSSAGVAFATLGSSCEGTDRDTPDMPQDVLKAYADLLAAGGTLVLGETAVRSAEEREDSAAHVPEVLERLLGAGFNGEAPAVRIVNPGTPAQRVSRGRMAELLAESEPPRGSSVLVLGEAARPGADLSWFEQRPLLGRTVVVTRPRGQARELSVELTDLGAVAEEFPTIAIRPPGDPEPLREAVRNVRSYDWVVFTSTNGVDRFWEELLHAGSDSRALGGARVACIGPGTAAAVERHGIRPDVIPDTYVAEELAAAIAAEGPLDDLRILLPRAAVARPVLPERLQALGARVDEVEAYRAVPDTEGADRMRNLIRSSAIDAITFTASSTVANFVDAIGRAAILESARPVIAAIGPITAATARERGLPVDVVANEHTIPGLVEALVAHFGGVVFRGASG